MTRGAILLIEDRDDVREGLAQLLELRGFVVCDVRDARQGMAQLSCPSNGIALVILDLLLQGSMCGIEFRHRQLADPQLARVPTIVITAIDVKEEDRLPLRADGWLDKPFRFDDLLALVVRHVVPEGQGHLAVD